jgi:DNA polymerase-3 subunit beta
MKITCEREKLLGAFGQAAGVAPARSPHPILKNVKIEVQKAGAVLLATDLELGVRVEVPNVQAETPGTAVLPIDRFSAILRESSDEKLLIETDGQGIIVETQHSKFNLPAENPDEFPAVATFSEQKYHELSGRFFRELIRRTAFATDVESTRYALGGVLVELAGNKVTAVSTDGRRLAKVEGRGEAVGGHGTGDSTTIIPTRAMQALERLLADGETDVQLAARPNDVLVRTKQCTVYSRLVEGRFPNWRGVLPDTSRAQSIQLVAGPTHSAVRQAAITASEDSRGVDFTFGDGRLVLTGRSADRGQSRVELPVPYDGSPISIMLDPRFFADFLKVLEPEKTFTLQLIDSENPAVCTTDDGYMYVIMPLARDH